jgi:serine/threonine protein kinase
MATVHRALERGIEGFERVVALKRLLPHLAADATFIKSFVREAKLASILNHVNIVQIFELGRVGTQYFISMEHIEGRDIRQILRHARKVAGPPPIHITVGLLLQLCEALDYAHHKVDDAGQPMGLVHRDVSPSNVLVTTAGQVKVIDFGIAKAQSAQLRTQTGRVKGKLAYMAPEALAGKDLDARSDLFAVGVIAHELVTARPLFAAKNEYQTLMKLQRGEVMPPSTFNQHCPPELDAIVLRALARDPDDRFPDACDLLDELHAMRKQYNLQTSDRDLATWLEWTFLNEASGGAATPDADADPARGQPRARSQARRTEDDDAVEMAWCGQDDRGGEPIVLDDVPDVSANHLQSASALGAEARVDLDDLGDDIPTPVPSHGKPAVDPARTATAPLRPRRRNQRPSGASRPGEVPRIPDDPPLAGDDGATLINAAPITEALVEAMARQAAAQADPPPVQPSRVRTITMPPRTAAAAAAAAPRNIAAATLPPRIIPAAGEGSRGVPVPVPVPPSRSGPVTADRARSIPIPPSRSGGIPTDRLRGGGSAASRSGALAETSRRDPDALAAARGVPVAIDATTVSAQSRPHSAEPSRPTMMPRSAATALPAAPRVVPSSSVAPRERRPTAPGTGAGNGHGARTATPMSGIITPLIGRAASEGAPIIRDTLLDMSGDRTPVYGIENLASELVNAADTVPALPSLNPPEPPHDPPRAMVRFREPTMPPPVGSPSASPSASAGASTTSTTSTDRQRLITPATELFAEPETETSAPIVTTTSSGVTRPSNHTIPDVPVVRAPRGLIGRIAAVVLGLAAVGTAAAGAALYLTRDDAAANEPQLEAPPAPPVTVGTIRFEVVPSGAEIAITGGGPPVHTISTSSVDLAPGVYQVEVSHDGYRGLLTSIDVAAGENQTLHAALDALGSAVISGATLVLDSTPHGLEIAVDGVAFGTTPNRLSIASGHHALVLRAEGGTEVWHKDIDAHANVVYDFHPALPASSNAPAAPAPTVPAPAAAPAPPPDPSAPSSGEPGMHVPAPATEAPAPSPGQAPPPAPAAQDPAASPVTASSATPPSAAPPPPGPAAPIATAAPPATPPSGPPPLTVSSGAVTRISGGLPRISVPANAVLPPTISAKLCIDETGRVSYAAMTTALDPGIAAQIVGTLRDWQYAPYQSGGVARPACFSVAFHP